MEALESEHQQWESSEPPKQIRWPVMLQQWKLLTFLHWRYDPSVIRPLLPPGMHLDTFDGSAWIGLVPFLLINLRLPFAPAFPWISRFPETNVRTYVRGPDGRPGVWFFTLEAERLIAVMGARMFYRLPYRWARMSVTEQGSRIDYRSDRKPPFGKAKTRITVEPGERIQSDPFDNFLTARFRLYTSIGKQIAFADVEHPSWPLQRARVLHLDQNLIQNSGVIRAVGEPAVHFSRSLDVRIGRLRFG